MGPSSLFMIRLDVSLPENDGVRIDTTRVLRLAGDTPDIDQISTTAELKLSDFIAETISRET